MFIQWQLNCSKCFIRSTKYELVLRWHVKLKKLPRHEKEKPLMYCKILTEHWVLAPHITNTSTRATTSPQKHWILSGTISVHLFLCQFSLFLHASTTHVSQVFAVFLSWHGCVKHQPFANVRDMTIQSQANETKNQKPTKSQRRPKTKTTSHPAKKSKRLLHSQNKTWYDLEQRASVA